MTDATTTRPRGRTLASSDDTAEHADLRTLHRVLTILALVDVGLIVFVHSPQVDDISAAWTRSCA